MTYALRAKAATPAPGGAAIDYAEAKEIVRNPDPAVRQALANRTDVQPEILYYLAEDGTAAVRRAIAANPTTPLQADRLLVSDRDEVVRGELAGKVARLLPGLSPVEMAQARRRIVEMIETLARDEAVHVRQVVADTLKEMADAPPEVIRLLAQDTELAVASPVLRFSPLLTDADLLEIIAHGPRPGVLEAIAGRSEVRGPVADAIAKSDDVPAVSVLLANPSAQIREETLDLILDRAPTVPSWHRPLVERPELPQRAARRIAGFVAETLLEQLVERPDLDPKTRAQLKTEVRQRLAATTEARPTAKGSGGAAVETESPEDKVRALKAAGKLNAETVSDALEEGQAGLVKAAIAELAGLPRSVIDRCLAARSAKGVTALAWTAGLSPWLAIQLQRRLAGIAPRQVLRARDGDQWPLDPAQMNWHLEFFGG